MPCEHNLSSLQLIRTHDVPLPNRISHWLREHLYILAGPICILILLAPMLSGRSRLAFRDGSHFYTPLYQFVAEQTDQHGWLAPIWNSYDQTGLPLAGETTTAVHYPVRAIVYAIGGSADANMAWYVAIHLVLASITASTMARGQRLSAIAAGCVGVAYPLSGSILFLATNPPYLVSAAWLPLAVVPLLGFKSCRSHRSWLLSSVAIAMMVLGGDPPTVLHLVIVLVVVHGVNAFGIGVRFATPRKLRRNEVVSYLKSSLGTFSLSLILATCLSAPQLAASMDWASQSDRSIQRPESETLAFSVPAWRTAEFLIPNAFGCPWPINTRWDRLAFSGDPSDPRLALWTPSLYMGALLPFCLVYLMATFVSESPLRRLRGFSTRSQSSSLRHRRAFTWTVISLFAGWCAMGSFGGPYEWMLGHVPGYQSLRYPSKWLPFVSLGLAMLVGISIDRVSKRPRMAIGSWLLMATAVLIVGGLVVAGLSVGMIQRLSSNPIQFSDPFWGPMSFNDALADAKISWAHAAIVATTLVVIVSIRLRHDRYRSLLLCAVLTLDLMMAHRSFVPQVPRTAPLEPTQQSKLATNVEPTATLWMRNELHGGWPKKWAETSSIDRMIEVETLARASWWGRWHLLDHARMFNSGTSLRAAELSLFWSAAKRVSLDLPVDQRPIFWKNIQSWLGIDGRITLDSTGEPIVHRSVEPRLDSMRTTKDIVIRPLETTAQWVTLLQAIHQSPNAIPLHLTDDSMTVSGDANDWLLRRVYQDGHWRAMIRPVDAPESSGSWQSRKVFKANGIHQAISIPPGRWTVRFLYQPWWHLPLMMTAVTGWAILVAGLLMPHSLHQNLRCYIHGRAKRTIG